MPAIITLSGPSGSGKTYLADQLIGLPNFSQLTTCTTRTPRTSEKDGEAYYFLTIPEFQRQDQLDQFIETNCFNGTWYGARKGDMRALLDRGQNVIMVCDPNGAYALSQWGEQNKVLVISIYIDCPRELLVQRIYDRAETEGGQLAALKSAAERLFTYEGEERHWKSAMNYSMRVSPAKTPHECSSRIRDIQYHLLTELKFLSTKVPTVWRGFTKEDHPIRRQLFIDKAIKTMQSHLPVNEKVLMLSMLTMPEVMPLAATVTPMTGHAFG